MAVKEYSNFGASAAVGFYGGALSASFATGVCVALGVATGGVGALACGIVGAAVGGYGFGKAAEKATGLVMDMIL